MLSKDRVLVEPRDNKFLEMILGGSDSPVGQGLLLVIILLIVLLNLVLILLIVCTSALRHSTKHVLVINVAVGDLLMGVLVTPLLLDVGNRKEWGYTCHVLNILELFRTSLIPSVTCLGLFMVNLFYILRITSSQTTYKYLPYKSETFMPVALGCAVWLVSIIVLVPLYFGATVPGDVSFVHVCSRVIGNDDTAVLYVFLSYVPQAVFILVSACVMVFVHTPFYLSKNLLFYGERLQVPLDAILVTFTTLALYTPFFILEYSSITYRCSNSYDCRLLTLCSQVSVWLVLTKSFIVPLCWLCCRDVRRAAKCICCG